MAITHLMFIPLFESIAQCLNAAGFEESFDAGRWRNLGALPPRAVVQVRVCWPLWLGDAPVDCIIHVRMISPWGGNYLWPLRGGSRRREP